MNSFRVSCVVTVPLSTLGCCLRHCLPPPPPYPPPCPRGGRRGAGQQHKSSLLTRQKEGLEAGQGSVRGGGPGRKAVLAQQAARLPQCLSLGGETPTDTAGSTKGRVCIRFPEGVIAAWSLTACLCLFSRSVYQP